MEQLLAARAPYEECLSALRCTFIDRGVTNAFGYPYPDYAIDVTKDGGNDKLIDECSAKHFNFVDMLYQTQPIAQQTQEETFVRAMPTLIACLEKGGVSVPDDPTPDELKEILHEVSGAQVANPDGAVQSLVMSCMSEVGIQAH